VLPHDEEERKAFGMRLVFRMICKCSKVVISHSESNRKALCRLYGLKSKNISIIKHGNYLLQSRDVKRFSQNEAKKALGLNPNDEVVLFFGAVREYKGIMDLLVSVKELSEKRPRLRLLIAGKAKEAFREKIESFIGENHLQKTIVFDNRYLGLQEFGLYFDACDVAALPYKHSYGSGALQTAMAFSKPIVLTDLPFFREIVIENENGLFFEYGNIESLSEMIDRFFSLPKKNQILMAQASLAIAKDNYGWGPIADKTSSLYRQIASRFL
jgi:glycosyltransferase involved in cell wall biosynthesis